MEVLQKAKPNKMALNKPTLVETKSGKVSVVHYVNTKIAARSYSDSQERYYPLYIRITAKRQVTSIKSLFQDYLFTETEPLEEQIDKKMLDFERELIENYILKNNLLQNPNFTISQVSSIHSNFIRSVFLFNDGSIKRELEAEIKTIFNNKGIDFDTFKNLFNDGLSDFDDLLRNKFSDFIQVFSKLIPELSKYENIDLFELTMQSAQILEKSYGVRA